MNFEENKIKTDENCDYNPDHIFVGHKEPEVYIMFALSQLLNGKDEVVLQARGMIIPKAISIAMILRENYIKNLKIEPTIDSVLLENNHVPTIKILLIKTN